MIYPIYPTCILKEFPCKVLSRIENQLKKSEIKEMIKPTPVICNPPEKCKKLKLSRVKKKCILFFSFRFLEFAI